MPDQLVCEIRDAGGAPVSPLAGYVPPREAALGGLGLWIARQLATWLVIEPDPSGGTVVRFGVERS